MVASYSVFGLHCNLETMKPDCEASEFQGSRESRPGGGWPMGDMDARRRPAEVSVTEQACRPRRFLFDRQRSCHYFGFVFMRPRYERIA
jgi:hypothetical protein